MLLLKQVLQKSKPHPILSDDSGPWEAYRNLTDEEISKVFAFLKSTKPVRNVVPTAKIIPPPKM